MSNSNAFSSLYTCHLLLKLIPISLRSLITLKIVPCSLYTQDHYKLEIVAQAGDPFTKEHAKTLFLKGYRSFFIHEKERELYVAAHRQELLKTARSLSIGDPVKKLHHQVELLNKGLKLLYLNPIDDELLQQQQRTIHNLSQFLYNEKGFIKKIYTEQIISPERYLYQQPLNSSLLLLGMLKFLKIFSEADTHSLFLTSYIKDIGMSLIPKEFESKKDPSAHDFSVMAKHAGHSYEILNGRINLNSNYLKIIQHHHAITSETDNIEISVGLESVLINIVDIFVAMTSARPYRDATSPYEALEKIKQLMLPKYAIEFKYLVHYLKKILK